MQPNFTTGVRQRPALSVLPIIQMEPGITKKGVALALGKSVRTAERYLAYALVSGFIFAVSGGGRGNESVFFSKTPGQNPDTTLKGRNRASNRKDKGEKRTFITTVRPILRPVARRREGGVSTFGSSFSERNPESSLFPVPLSSFLAKWYTSLGRLALGGRRSSRKMKQRPQRLGQDLTSSLEGEVWITTFPRGVVVQSPFTLWIRPFFFSRWRSRETKM